MSINIDFYKQKFASIPIEQKRRDLMQHPFVKKEEIKKAKDEIVEEVYLTVYSSMDMAMQDVIGESMFDDEDE
jgi:hypothetical protein